jgi:deazaflavin-dependent oxidoreductase (nitroreductase family)
MGRLNRFFMRAPLGLYRLGLGGLLGKRFLRLEHTGNKTGLPRQTVLEVVGIDNTKAPIVASGYGERSHWYRNVTANPEVAFTLGRKRVVATAERLDHTDAVAVLDRYRTNHARAAKVIGARLGVSLVDDLDTAAAKLPLFRLVPRAV